MWLSFVWKLREMNWVGCDFDCDCEELRKKEKWLLGEEGELELEIEKEKLVEKEKLWEREMGVL